MKNQAKEVLKVALPIAMLLSSSWSATSSNFNVEINEKEVISENDTKEFVVNESNVDDSVILAVGGWNCGYACSGSCGSSCTGSCSGTCRGGCNNTCAGTCELHCTGSCLSLSRY